MSFSDADLTEETKEIDKLIRDIHKHLVEYTKRNLKKDGLTMPRFKVLWYITKEQPVNMSFLHRKMYLSNSTLTIIVDKLVEEDLVDRSRNPEDRREVMLELTGNGEQLLCKMLSIRQEFLEKGLKDLDSGKKEELIELLSTTLDNLENLFKEGTNQHE